LEKTIRDANIISNGAKQRLQKDFQFFTINLSNLEDCDGPGSHLENLANNVKVKDKSGINDNIFSTATQERKPFDFSKFLKKKD
jgi:hypothetical protein